MYHHETTPLKQHCWYRGQHACVPQGQPCVRLGLPTLLSLPPYPQLLLPPPLLLDRCSYCRCFVSKIPMYWSA